MTGILKSFLAGLLLASVIIVFALVAGLIYDRVAQRLHAQERQEEIPPYKFADLPHGRIYKAVHEGCELFIVEGEMRVSGADDAGHFYAIATGRGCR
jgi:hypothetical protein